jgi:hypothetical protein
MLLGGFSVSRSTLCDLKGTIQSILPNDRSGRTSRPRTILSTLHSQLNSAYVSNKNSSYTYADKAYLKNDCRNELNSLCSCDLSIYIEKTAQKKGYSYENSCLRDDLAMSTLKSIMKLSKKREE